MALPAACALHNAARLIALNEMLDAADVPAPPGHGDWQQAPIIDPDAFHEVNRPQLAEKAGGALDLEAWEAEARRRLSD